MAKVRSGLILERLIEQALKFPYLGRCQLRILREVDEQRFGRSSENPIHERSAFRAHVPLGRSENRLPNARTPEPLRLPRNKSSQIHFKTHLSGFYNVLATKIKCLSGRILVVDLY